MRNFNQYIENVDLSQLRQFFEKYGVFKQMKKKEFFASQNDTPLYMGYVERGVFRYSRIDTQGREHILGYAFQNEYIGDYASCLRQMPLLVTIQAVTDASVYVLPFETMYSFWETDLKTQRLGRIVTEELFIQIYERMISLHCETAEERYMSLIKQCPEILNILTLKEIALYLSVTPETVSHIRKKMLNR